VRDGYRKARARETRFLMSFDLPRLNKRLIILLSVFITLNCLDALTTLVALKAGPPFMELNPIASGLFSHDFEGFAVALSLKYIPIVPLIYATYLKKSDEHPVAFRIVKVSAFVALAAADIFYLAVVGSNVRTLVAYYLALG
jgi:hypothetical protein